MLGNIGVHGSDGDRAAFAEVFDRHLPAVFAAAWAVLHDRAVAAEITRDTFAAAWARGGRAEAADPADSLTASARRHAEAWLDENPQGRAVADGPAGADPPALGPVLRARIVTALEVQGVPTRVATGTPDRQQGRRPSLRATAVGLGVTLVALVGGATVALTGGGGDPARSDDDAVETAAAEPAPDPDDDPAPTTSTADTTTTTTPAPTTSGTSPPADHDDEAPSPTLAVAPATTAPPPPPPTTAPRPVTTAPPAPTVPTILEFSGYSSGRSDCPSGQVRFHMSWRSVESTWVWVHTEGAVWEDVAAPDGSTSRCTTSGTLWYLEIRRDGDWLEDTATLRV